MYKYEFIELITSVVSGSKEAFRNDKPALRMLFNNMLDSYNRDGMITDSQATNWILTDRELNKLIRIIK